MFVSPMGRTPIRAAAAVRKVTRSATEEVAIDALGTSSQGGGNLPRRKPPELSQARTAAERSSADVLDALSSLKLGG